MAGNVLQIVGSRLSGVVRGETGDLGLRFDPARVVKSEGIPFADDSTLWSQSGTLCIAEAEVSGQWPDLPVICSGGSIEAGGFKYVDMIPMRLEAPNWVELHMTFEGDGDEVVITGSRGWLEMEGDPRYVRHLSDK